MCIRMSKERKEAWETFKVFLIGLSVTVAIWFIAWLLAKQSGAASKALIQGVPISWAVFLVISYVSNLKAAVRVRRFLVVAVLLLVGLNGSLLGAFLQSQG